ncbi:MAG: hypothetical protein ACRYHQ_11095 [Janthinobacterium lividum]
MQVQHTKDDPKAGQPMAAAPLLPRRSGTIPVTVRLDPSRYDRLKRLVLRLSTTGQSIMQAALDRSLPSLERERVEPGVVPGQSSLFTTAAAGTATLEKPRRPRQDSFAFVRPEPTVALTYRASVPMHRWLHRRSQETGQSIQDIIDGALKAAQEES